MFYWLWESDSGHISNEEIYISEVKQLEETV
jgi:hypothetical protein